PSTQKVYAIVGPDGSGKTTIARVIAARLAEAGVRTRIAWMRSPRIVTLGVIGILRLARLAKTVRMGDHDDVHIDLKRHPLLLHLYAWSITFDYFLGYFGKVTIPRRLLRRTVICDRFAWDTLVDLGLTSGLDEGGRVPRNPSGMIRGPRKIRFPRGGPWRDLGVGFNSRHRIPQSLNQRGAARKRRSLGRIVRRLSPFDELELRVAATRAGSGVCG